MQSRSSKSIVRRFLVILFLSSLIGSLWLGYLPGPNWQAGWGVATAQSPDASQLVQQGVALYQAGNYRGAIAPWQTALSLYHKTNNRASEAIVWENLARAYQQLSQSEQALSYWELAIAYYRQTKDVQQVGRLLTEQAQNYSNLGQPRKAIAILCGEDRGVQDCVPESALQIAQTYKDRTLAAAALGSLGDAYRLRGNYNLAVEYLQASLKINDPVYRASTLNSLGNAHIGLAKANYRRANSANFRGDSNEADQFRKQAFAEDSQALKYFRDSLTLARTQKDRLGEVRVLLNLIPLYRRTQESTSSADEAGQQALALLENLPDSRTKVYAVIDLADLVQPVPSFEATALEFQCPRELKSKAEELLNQAVAIARRIQDPRSESFALGKLGHIYECRQNYEPALNFTRQAQWAADQDLYSKDSLYVWEWQAGRIFKAQGKELKAINAYERAIATLEEIRGDILIANRDLQFDFRDTVEPIYRELAALRLERSLTSTDSKERQQNLNTVLKTIDALKLAELQNYFGNDCVLTVNQGGISLLGADSATAVFSSIILKDHTAVLVSFPNGETKSEWIEVNSQTFKQEIIQFRQGLERFRDVIYDPKQAQKLYDWIVRPFANDLSQARIETLVFVQDGILRNVPMAALHNGEKFLVQEYAIATTPSLTLTDSNPVAPQALRALALGLTTETTVNGRKFQALTNVRSEIGQIETQIPGSKQLLDQDFTRDRFRQELGETVYPIIHIATHGEFGTVPEDTFLVTGNNDKLTITDLDTIIRSVVRSTDSVELLALTACQTAVGDDRATLGLAGVAVQAGVRSALASLWSINDASTVTFVTEFYQDWHGKKMSKAAALGAAQRSLIEARGDYAHPYYWAPFILIGNWL